MKQILLFIILIPSFSFCQTKKTGGVYSQIGIGVDFPEGSQAFSARFDGGANIKNSSFIGVGVGVTKFDGMKGIYFPVYGNITLAFTDGTKKFFPIVNIQPGYGIYSSNQKIQNVNYHTKGGVTLYGALGLGLKLDKRMTNTFQIGYSTYTFTTENEKSTRNGLAARITLMFL